MPPITVAEVDNPTEQISEESVNQVKSKVYTLCGKQFKLKPPCLQVDNVAVQYASALNKNIFIFTAAIPIHEVDAVEYRLNDELKYAYEQCLDVSKQEALPADERMQQYAEYERIKAIYDAELEAFKNDTWLQNTKRHYNQQTHLAEADTMTDEAVILPVLRGILDGEVEVLKADAEGLYDFIREVMTDFFTLRSMNSSKSATT